jgi:PPOX class probable F420-dependent enzyme
MESLVDAEFVLRTTFRRDGRAVGTAVWVAPLDDGLGVWTAADSGKVKRIRRDGAVTVAVCDRRGAPSGTAVPGRARVLDAAGTARVRAAVVAKYGLVGRVLTALSRWRRGSAGTVGLAITLG